MARVRTCHVGDIPTQGCTVVAEGRALLVRTGGNVAAYENRCLHTSASLDGATVRDGVLMCPRHFWRYRTSDGRLVSGGGGALTRFDVTIDSDGTVVVDVPERPAVSVREQLLQHARTWSRDG